jgi:MFS family permease
MSTIPPPQPSKGLLRAFSSLRLRNFRLYWFGQMISLLGTWMQRVGQAWLVLELTHSAWQLGLVGTLQYLPVLLFSIFGGVLADRWSKRRILLVTQSVDAIQAVLLWILIITGTIQTWHIYVLATVLGLTNSLDQPTRSAFVIEMVGREELPNAVALNSSLLNLTRIVGPGLAGILIAALGTPPLFLLNALSFLAVILALLLIDSRKLHIQALPTGGGGEQQNTWRSLREGIDYARKTLAVALIIVVVGLVLLFAANFDVLLPLFATDVLHVGARDFGFLSASIGIGSVIAALWLAWSNLRPTISRILIGILVLCGLEVVFAVIHIYPLSLLLIASCGATETIAGTLTFTILQPVAPDHLRGRVISIYILFFTGSAPLGFLLAGWLSSLYGASDALLICALLGIVVAGAGWIWWRLAEKNLENQHNCREVVKTNIYP